jgi:hypothetical protein
MKILYLLLICLCCSVWGNAQIAKLTDSPAQSSSLDLKVLRFYPNPATSVINFEVQKPLEKAGDKTSDKTYTLQIFNFIGKKIVEINNFSQKNSIPLNDFFRGVYIFQLRDKTGRIVESGKFQIAK